VTDSGSKDVTTTCIDVQVYRPLRFFGAYGEIEQDAFGKALQQHSQRLIGWFAFRANTPLRVSVKEHAVHAQLEKLASSQLQSAEPAVPLLFAMLTSSATTNNSTQSFDYRFVSRPNEKVPFSSMELSITNPEHKSQAEYGEFSAFATFSGDSVDDKGIALFNDVPGPQLQTLHSFAASQQEHVNKLIEELEIADVEEQKLAAEVEALRTEHQSLAGQSTG